MVGEGSAGARHLSDVAPPRTKAPCHTVPKVDMTGAASTALHPDGTCAYGLRVTAKRLKNCSNLDKGSFVDSAVLRIAAVAHQSEHGSNGCVALVKGIQQWLPVRKMNQFNTQKKITCNGLGQASRCAQCSDTTRCPI